MMRVQRRYLGAAAGKPAADRNSSVLSVSLPCAGVGLRVYARRWVNCLAWLQIVAVSAMAAENPARDFAARLLDATGEPRGFCCVLDRGDGALAAALAQQSQMVVLAVEASPAQVMATRATAQAAGRSSRLYAAVGTPDAIPLTSDYADLLVLAGLDDAALAKLPAGELLRVAAPRFGRIYLGGVGGRLTRSALTAWLTSAGLDVGAVVQDGADGVWAVARKPARKGVANWGNWQGGSDNNPLSADTAYAYPDSLQYLNLPSQTGPAFAVAAGGRFFSGFAPDEHLVEHNSNAGVDAEPAPVLYAWQGYNGRQLWKRQIKDGFGHRIWVATDDVFYLPEANQIVALDAGTGRELYRITAGEAPARIIWLNVAGGMGCLLTSTNTSRGLPESGNRLAVYDLATRKLAWEHVEKPEIDYSSVGTSGDRLVFCAPKSRVAMLDLKTGREVWSNEKVYVSEDGDNTRKPAPYTPVNSLLLCPTQAVVVLFGDEPARIVAFAADDGHVLWRKKRGVGQSNFALVKGRRLQSNNLPGCFSCDLLTGGEPDARGVNGGCGRCTAVEEAFINQFGSVYEVASHKGKGEGYAKPICAIGNFVANGIRYGGPPGGCRCGFTFRGFTAWGPAEKKGRPAVEPALLTADAAEPPVVAATDEDWPQYRRDAMHSCSTPVAVGRTAMKQLWLSPVGSAVQPTPATAVAGLVFTADSAGSIACLDAASGLPRWRLHTGGRIFFQPTVAEGRVYAGSADGRIYCLAAATGKLLWQFRPGPAGDRLLVYNDLMSRWPVNSNILVQDGTVYAVAGLIDSDGVYGCALDARTGQPRWINADAGHYLPGTRDGFVPMGALALAGDFLWFRSDKGSPSACDRRTGALQDPPPEKNGKPGARQLLPGDGVVGRDLALFAGRYLMSGGHRLFSAQTERYQSIYVLNKALEVDAAGKARYPWIATHDRGVGLMPSWDRDLYVSPVHRAGAREPLHTLNAFSCSNMVSALDTMHASGKYYRPPPKLPESIWQDAQHTINAVVVCRDAVLIAEMVQKDPRTPLFSQWSLTALDRAGGAELWHEALPAEPVIDGITVDRAGRMLVAMTDGRIACYGE